MIPREMNLMLSYSARTSPVALTILVDKSKSVDDVITIARVEGRKKLGRNVRIIDLVRESQERFVVLVVPKYRSLDVGARRGMEAD
jgi:hypothetical protein